MVPGGKVFMGARQGRIFVFFGSSAKSLQNVQKISRKATEIIDKSTENQLKPKKTNGFQRESAKVGRICAKSVKKYGICQNIASGGVPPPTNPQ